MHAGKGLIERGSAAAAIFFQAASGVGFETSCLRNRHRIASRFKKNAATNPTRLKSFPDTSFR
jgi:hypothetical protein